MDQEYIDKAIEFVKSELLNAEAGHDWFHVERVYKNTLQILDKEPDADRLICQMAALLHDIADSKFYDGDESVGPNKARQFLQSISLPYHKIDAIVYIIENMSFKNSFNNPIISNHSIELKIVQDADRLDAIGAIGIARAFNYGGYKNRRIYDPEILPSNFKNKEEYKSSKGTTFNHFYEKLVHLKDSMQTEYGKKMAQNRHDFMIHFMNQFLAEWNVES